MCASKYCLALQITKNGAMGKITLPRKVRVLPSVELSQKQELAECNPAPFFCMITQVTMYLNGLPSLVSWLKVCSRTLVVHWLTLLCW